MLMRKLKRELKRKLKRELKNELKSDLNEAFKGYFLRESKPCPLGSCFSFLLNEGS